MGEKKSLGGGIDLCWGSKCKFISHVAQTNIAMRRTNSLSPLNYDNMITMYIHICSSKMHVVIKLGNAYEIKSGLIK